MPSKRPMILAIIIDAITVVPGSGQHISKCLITNDKQGPSHRIGKTTRTILDGHAILEFQISVAPKHFNEKDMTALAFRLNKEFCHEGKMSVAITDQYQAAKSNDLISDLLRKTPNPALRGVYNLDRNAGESNISFSTERGRRLDEVHLTFEKNRMSNL